MKRKDELMKIMRDNVFKQLDLFENCGYDEDHPVMAELIEQQGKNIEELERLLTTH